MERMGFPDVRRLLMRRTGRVEERAQRSKSPDFDHVLAAIPGLFVQPSKVRRVTGRSWE
jgi:hypothetical protein